MSKILRVSALAVIASVLFGNALACNTAEGVGKDTQKVGEKIEDTADRNK